MIRATLSRCMMFTAGVFLALGMSVLATAEDAKPPQDDASRIERMKQALEAENGTQQTELAPILLPKEQLDLEALRSMQASIKAYYDYRSQGFEHRRAVFAWQLLSSKIIFSVVVLLVAVGIYFSWIQFTAGMQDKRAAPLASADPATAASPAQAEGAIATPPVPTATTLEASPTGIKVSSPVLGVILLVISLLFFYLYLVHIYPIEEIF